MFCFVFWPWIVPLSRSLLPSPSRSRLRLARERSMRRARLRFATQGSHRRAAPLRGRRSRLAFTLPDLVSLLHRPLSRGGHRIRRLGFERYACSTRLREANRDGLLRGTNAVLALPDMVNLFPDELPRGRRGRLALAQIFLRSSKCCFLWHRCPPTFDPSKIRAHSGHPFFAAIADQRCAPTSRCCAMPRGATAPGPRYDSATR
jgi:hypothetical protein